MSSEQQTDKRAGEIRHYPAVILGISVRTSRKFRLHRHDDHEVQLDLVPAHPLIQKSRLPGEQRASAWASGA